MIRRTGLADVGRHRSARQRIAHPAEGRLAAQDGRPAGRLPQRGGHGGTGSAAAPLAPGRDDAGFAVPPQPGRQWTERRLLAALRRVLKQLKLPEKLHTFRHSFISNALLEGTAVAVLREWVGHIDRSIIDLYTHIHNGPSPAVMQRRTEANHEPLQSGESSHDAK